MSQVHITGYVCRKDEMDEHELFDATKFCAQKYLLALPHELDRGGLEILTFSLSSAEHQCLMP